MGLRLFLTHLQQGSITPWPGHEPKSPLLGFAAEMLHQDVLPNPPCEAQLKQRCGNFAASGAGKGLGLQVCGGSHPTELHRHLTHPLPRYPSFPVRNYGLKLDFRAAQ